MTEIHTLIPFPAQEEAQARRLGRASRDIAQWEGVTDLGAERARRAMMRVRAQFDDDPYACGFEMLYQLTEAFRSSE